MKTDTKEKSFTELSKESEFSALKVIYYPKLAKTLVYWLIAIAVIAFLILFLPWTQNIRANGLVTALYPEDRPQTIHSTISGRIEKWYVVEGQSILKGDTIAKISEIKDKYFDPLMITRIQEQIEAKQGNIRSTKDKADALKSQIDALYKGKNVSSAKARNKIQQQRLKVQSDSIDVIAAQQDNNIAEFQYERAEEMYKKDVISLNELEKRRNTYFKAAAKLLSSENKFYTSKNEYLNTVLELNSIEADYLDKISKAESDLNSALSNYYSYEGELSKMFNELSNVTIRSGFYYITAPQDGYLLKAMVTGIGETVKEGEPIVSILPIIKERAVELYVLGMDLPLLKPGIKVRLQFDGWPALVFSGWPGVSFGTFGGIVEVVDNIDTKGKFRILVKQDPDLEPWPTQVRVGSGVYGWAMLKDVPIWREIWRQLNGFPPDFVDEIPSYYNLNVDNKDAKSKDDSKSK